MIGQGIASGGIMGGLYGAEDGLEGASRGALIGGATGGATSGLLAAFTKAQSPKGLYDRINSVIKPMKADANRLYTNVKQADMRVRADSFDDIANDIYAMARREGLDRGTTKKAWSAAQRLLSERGKSHTIQEMDTLRKVLKGAAQGVDEDNTVARMMVQRFDDRLLTLRPQDVGGDTGALPELLRARQLWHTVKKAGRIGS